MRKLSLAIAFSCLFLSPVAGAQTLDELARIVREAVDSEAKINQEREAQFLRERNNQNK